MASHGSAAFSNQLHDMELVTLLDAANAVRDLQGQPGWLFVRGLVEARETRLQGQMLNASLPSYEQMASLAGELRGLRAMVAAAETVLEVAVEREHQAAQEVHGGNTG